MKRLPQPGLTGGGTVGRSEATTRFVIQYTDALNPPNWQVLTQFVGDGSLKTIVDHLAGPGTRFFRIGVR